MNALASGDPGDPPSTWAWRAVAMASKWRASYSLAKLAEDPSKMKRSADLGRASASSTASSGTSTPGSVGGLPQSRPHRSGFSVWQLWFAVLSMPAGRLLRKH